MEFHYFDVCCGKHNNLICKLSQAVSSGCVYFWNYCRLNIANGLYMGHPRAPGVASVDYVSNGGYLRCSHG